MEVRFTKRRTTSQESLPTQHRKKECTNSVSSTQVVEPFQTIRTESIISKHVFFFEASQRTRVGFNLKIGFEAKDYSQIAKKEHLKPLEVHEISNHILSYGCFCTSLGMLD